ncbi:MAG: SDR family NAD(P)-dependent oxidoreductase [Gemmatimonadetes bacterium]|nr:SDR family NAD(P)-dependent oxidoreductase [Gemmatimonadota bacterium]
MRPGTPELVVGLYSKRYGLGRHDTQNVCVLCIEVKATVRAGKVAVITGGNSGIGLASARRYVSRGARVAILGRDPTTVEAAVAELGDAAVGVVGDVRNLQDIDRLYDTVKREFGSIDFWFVNAGVAKMRPLEAVDEEHFDHLFAVNVKGAYFTVQRGLPLLNDGGTIVLNTSITNQLGIPSLGVYSATKAATAE